ncbi:tyrosine-protein phosphatase [Microbacterium sp. NPDC089189]|uniref:tyrosine-protein phosphatase n=1 Tax=Microbacterium sp. NPDC089189 TaxID=3154972 RepID=UPI0034403067
MTTRGKIDVPGTYNFRDLGGLPLTAGGETAAGVLYRSDALHALTPEGEAIFADLPIGVVVDFRTAAERDTARDRLPHGRHIADLHLPLLEGAMSHLVEEALKARVLGDHTAAGRAAEAAMANLPTLGELYVSMLEHGAASFARVARLVVSGAEDAASPGAGADAVLFHCTAGKDRTGVCAAVLLDAVGVERSAIVADYASSEENLRGPWLARMTGMVQGLGVEVTPGLAELIGGTPPAAIEQALAWLDDRGGSAAYLASGGFGDLELAALRARLTA